MHGYLPIESCQDCPTRTKQKNVLSGFIQVQIEDLIAQYVIFDSEFHPHSLRQTHRETEYKIVRRPRASTMFCPFRSVSYSRSLHDGWHRMHWQPPRVLDGSSQRQRALYGYPSPLLVFCKGCPLPRRGFKSAGLKGLWVHKAYERQQRIHEKIERQQEKALHLRWMDEKKLEERHRQKAEDLQRAPSSHKHILRNNMEPTIASI